MSPIDSELQTRTAYLPLRSVKVSLVRQLYEVHERAYEHTSLDAFTQELKRQTGVLLLQRQRDGLVVGFSTQTLCTMALHGETARGLFTGPMIVDQEYRSDHALLQATCRRLFLERLKRPLAPFYWFFTASLLVDYLQMTHRFPHHYPALSGSDQRHLELAQACCAQLFPHAFDRHRMLLDFAEGHARPKLDQSHPLIDAPATERMHHFFETQNPTWRSGTELPCVAECDWGALWRGMQTRLPTDAQRPSNKRAAIKPGQPS